uniref:Secreted protein n=1 Tax=Haemonchus contortus TaxID=6289 RepID=A0A7I4YCE7_HAECO
MFFILTVLALSIPNVVSQESPFTESSLEELQTFSKGYFGDVAALGTGVNYGCNGLLDRRKPEKDCIIVGCLFSSTKQ